MQTLFLYQRASSHKVYKTSQLHAYLDKAAGPDLRPTELLASLTPNCSCGKTFVVNDEFLVNLVIMSRAFAP